MAGADNLATARDTRVPSMLTRRPGFSREAIYRLLLNSPGRPWSVADAAQALTQVAISASSVRETFYVLQTDGLLEPVGGHRALTWRLTAAGATALKSILDTWRSR